MSYIISFVWLWRSFVDVGRPRWTPVSLAIISLQMYNMSLLESSQVFYWTCVRATIFSAIDRSSTCACIIAPWDLQIREFFLLLLYIFASQCFIHARHCLLCLSVALNKFFLLIYLICWLVFSVFVLSDSVWSPISLARFPSCIHSISSVTLQSLFVHHVSSLRY